MIKMISVTFIFSTRILIWVILIAKINCQENDPNRFHPSSLLQNRRTESRQISSQSLSNTDGISLCDTFNCRSVIDLLTWEGDNTSASQLPDLEGPAEPHCYYFFGVPKCYSQPVLKDEKVNVTLFAKILSTHQKFSNWSVADCPSYERAVKENCLIYSTDNDTNHKVMESLQPTRRLENLLEGKNREKCRIKIDMICMVVIVILSIFLVGSFLINLHQLRKNRTLSTLRKEEIELFSKAFNSTPPEVGRMERIMNVYQKDKFHELSKDSFTIHESSILGIGFFGKICWGTVTKDGYADHVAVKVMTRPYGRYYALRGLVQEVENLSYLGSHPNIVELKGVYSAELGMGSLFVFLELCELGSLLSFLRKFKLRNGDYDEKLNGRRESSSVAHDSSLFSLEVEETEMDQVLIQDMNRWSLEIAGAMAFIASKDVVHRDIASRNVYLTGAKQAKLSNFALSRRMYDTELYTRKAAEPLPWRSMAPESLRRREYNAKSDVWAFGIMLWEIYTLGSVPYFGLAWSVDFPSMLENGLRLPKPTYNINNIYSVMLRCWDPNPGRRPSFSKLVKLLSMNSPGVII